MPIEGFPTPQSGAENEAENKPAAAESAEESVEPDEESVGTRSQEYRDNDGTAHSLGSPRNELPSELTEKLDQKRATRESAEEQDE